MRAAATRITCRAGTADGVEAIWNGAGAVRLFAGVTILTAGVGNLELVESAAFHRGRATNRTSYMLVLVGAGLTDLTAIISDHEAYGLFLASRPHSNGHVWLVSDYVSFGGDINSLHAAGLWTRSVARTLNRLTTVFEDPEIRWGVYPAAKGEVRSDRSTLSQHVVDTFGIRRLFVGSPTKLTLAPLLAQELANQALRVPSRGRTSFRPPLPSGDELEALPERWKDVQLMPLSNLFEFVLDARAEPAPFIG